MEESSRRRWRLLPVKLIALGIICSTTALLFVLAWKVGGLEFGPLGIALTIPLGPLIVVWWVSLLAGIDRRRDASRYRLVLGGTTILVLGVIFAAIRIGTHEMAREAARQAAFDQLPER